MESRPTRIPVASTNPQFDLASPRYRGLNPATYAVLAFCYDSLAAPSVHTTHGDPLPGIWTSDYRRMIPRLAESFTEDADGNWILRLRRSVSSNDGNELSADDIRWTFDQAFARQSVGAYRWGQIAGLADPTDLHVIDSRTLRIKLRSPNPNAAAFLFGGAPPIFDSSSLIAHASDRDPWAAEWISKGKVAGFGPYALAELARDRLRFEARADYWAGSPPVSSILVDRVDSRSDALKALDSTQPTYVVGLRPDEVRGLRERDDLVLSASWAGHAYLAMSFHVPPFDDTRVRHALSYATPYDEVIEKGLLGLGRRWRGAIGSSDVWHTHQSWHYDTSAQKAKDLLRSAGYAQGLSIALYLSMRPDLLRIAEVLRLAYGQIGVELEIRDLLDVTPGWSPAFILRTECGHNFYEPVYDIAHDYIPIQPIVPPSDGKVVVATWLPGYSNSEHFNELYRGILLAPTAAEREDRTVSMQTALIEFAPFVYLAENLHVNASNSHVSPWMRDPSSRPVQALQFQNCNTSYIG
jgi:ABC-type transport system substrate-binding protein